MARYHAATYYCYLFMNKQSANQKKIEKSHMLINCGPSLPVTIPLFIIIIKNDFTNALNVRRDFHLICN